MSKRSVGRVARKGTAARKRDAVKDLSAQKARAVVGGLLPAVQPARASASRSPGTTNLPLEQGGFPDWGGSAGRG
jgi:hypothetical protein